MSHSVRSLITLALPIVLVSSAPTSALISMSLFTHPSYFQAIYLPLEASAFLMGLSLGSRALRCLCPGGKLFHFGTLAVAPIYFLIFPNIAISWAAFLLPRLYNSFPATTTSPCASLSLLLSLVGLALLGSIVGLEDGPAHADVTIESSKRHALAVTLANCNAACLGGSVSLIQLGISINSPELLFGGSTLATSCGVAAQFTLLVFMPLVSMAIHAGGTHASHTGTSGSTALNAASFFLSTLLFGKIATISSMFLGSTWMRVGLLSLLVLGHVATAMMVFTLATLSPDTPAYPYRPSTTSSGDPSLAVLIKLQDGKMSLSSREHECLSLALDGLTSDAIADKLGLRPSTARNYMQRAYRKLNVTSLEELKNSVAKTEAGTPCDEVTVTRAQIRINKLVKNRIASRIGTMAASLSLLAVVLIGTPNFVAVAVFSVALALTCTSPILVGRLDTSNLTGYRQSRHAIMEIAVVTAVSGASISLPEAGRASGAITTLLLALLLRIGYRSLRSTGAIGPYEAVLVAVSIATALLTNRPLFLAVGVALCCLAWLCMHKGTGLSLTHSLLCWVASLCLGLTGALVLERFSSAPVISVGQPWADDCLPPLMTILALGSLAILAQTVFASLESRFEAGEAEPDKSFEERAFHFLLSKGIAERDSRIVAKLLSGSSAMAISKQIHYSRQTIYAVRRAVLKKLRQETIEGLADYIRTNLT